MPVQIWSGYSGMRSILKGAQTVSEAVKVTLGPGGRNCLLQEKEGCSPLIVNDGMTIAKAIELEDELENMGARLIRDAALKVQELVGDGTSTVIMLSCAMLEEACKNIAAGARPTEVRKGMQMTARLAVACLEKMARPVQDSQDILAVASVAAKDTTLGKYIADAMQMAGPEGVVSVEESLQDHTTLEFSKGIVFERGYLHPHMITDQKRSIVELYHPYILITDCKLDNPRELVPVLEIAKNNNRSLFVIADSIEPTVMGFLMKNKDALSIDIAAVHPPMYGEGRKWRLTDLAVQTGGTFITADTGLSLKDVREDMLGSAGYIRAEKMKTTIREAEGDPETVKIQENRLRHLVETTDYAFNKERYRERLAKFVSGVAVIKAGAVSETEMKEIRFRLEDGCRAVRAAQKEGIVPGGGTAFVDILPPLQAFADSLEEEKRTGACIIISALKRPMEQIADNAGFNGWEVQGNVRKEKRGVGFDVRTGQYTDMFARGIVDPAMTARLQIQTAVSVVGTVLTSQAFLSEI